MPSLAKDVLARAGSAILGTRSAAAVWPMAPDHARTSRHAQHRKRPAQTLDTLVYELLDAHHDTARLAAALSHDPQWAAHLEYLRALQRRGREALARSLPAGSPR